MMGNEIATAWQYGANPIMIISDNRMYGTVKTRPVVVHCLTSAIRMSAWCRYTRSDALP
jgi:thiamine pyrophosphate-dependent acetolactate synthase large subunit-like protein